MMEHVLIHLGKKNVSKFKSFTGFLVTGMTVFPSHDSNLFIYYYYFTYATLYLEKKPQNSKKHPQTKQIKNSFIY